MRELTTKLAAVTKALTREEDLRTKYASELKSMTDNMESEMVDKEKKLTAEVGNLRFVFSCHSFW